MFAYYFECVWVRQFADGSISKLLREERDLVKYCCIQTNFETQVSGFLEIEFKARMFKNIYFLNVTSKIKRQPPMSSKGNVTFILSIDENFSNRVSQVSI